VFQPFAWAALWCDPLCGIARWVFNLEEDCHVMFDRAQHTLAKVDAELWSAIQAENTRQEDHIELIASENYTSPAVMEAQGSQASATTVVASTWTWSSNWPLTA
jgi:hypothetical protein